MINPGPPHKNIDASGKTFLRLNPAIIIKMSAVGMIAFNFAFLNEKM